MSHIDLHMHSKYSLDGEATVEEIISKCKVNNVDTFAITDHNSVQAVVEAMKLACEEGITCIPGIEIDCNYLGVNFHLLAYGIDYKDEGFIRIEEEYLKMEKDISQLRILKINEMGFNLDYNQLVLEFNEGIIIPEDIAKILLNDSDYDDIDMLKQYRPGGNRSDNPYVNFYWDYFSQGKSCYVPEDLPAVEDVIRIVKNAGGVTMIAHPGANFGKSHDKLLSLLELDIHGLEVFSTYHNEDQTKLYYDLAMEKKLLLSAGSDYHGENKPSITIGNIPTFGTNIEPLNKIIELLKVT